MVKKLQQIPEMLLMGPGPSTVPPEVYAALSAPTLGHMDPRFIAIMDAIKADMQKILNTDNRCTVPMSGTGSAGMETCFVNLVEKGDKVLILINGVFGRRMQDVAGRLGAEVEALEFEWERRCWWMKCKRNSNSLHTRSSPWFTPKLQPEF